jgi:hypothetical protein
LQENVGHSKDIRGSFEKPERAAHAMPKAICALLTPQDGPMGAGLSNNRALRKTV